MKNLFVKGFLLGLPYKNLFQHIFFLSKYSFQKGDLFFKSINPHIFKGNGFKCSGKQLKF